MIEFDPETHTYKVDGRVVPSVTQILGVMGCGNNRFYTDEGRERGKAIDDLTEMSDAGTLDLEAARERYPQYVGYVEAWISFRAEMQFDCRHIQLKVAHAELGYAGTLDRLGAWPAIPADVLIDIKSGAPEWWHPLQTQGYAACIRSPKIERACVYLTSLGKWKWRQHDDPADAAGWLSFLNAYNYRKNRGAKDE